MFRGYRVPSPQASSPSTWPPQRHSLVNLVPGCAFVADLSSCQNRTPTGASVHSSRHPDTHSLRPLLCRQYANDDSGVSHLCLFQPSQLSQLRENNLVLPKGVWCCTLPAFFASGTVGSIGAIPENRASKYRSCLQHSRGLVLSSLPARFRGSSAAIVVATDLTRPEHVSRRSCAMVPVRLGQFTHVQSPHRGEGWTTFQCMEGMAAKCGHVPLKYFQVQRQSLDEGNTYSTLLIWRTKSPSAQLECGSRSLKRWPYIIKVPRP